jgi:rare lipoprotein A (peptidoglycan hydrolase)
MRLCWKLLKRSLYPCVALLMAGTQGCSVTAPSGDSHVSHEASSIQSQPKVRLVSTGRASWYGPGFRGRKTASGEIFDDSKFTAAHKTLPLGTIAKVTNLSNGKSVKVEINDRGPYVDGRIIDLSHAAAHALGMVDRGVAHVEIEPVSDNSEGVNSINETSRHALEQ